jgi:FMNH2-dependent dimethyl sulfone monooxygenase
MSSGGCCGKTPSRTQGALYQLDGTVLEPKPSRLPPVYMGGESPKAKDVIAAQADAYVMHGDAPDVIAAKVGDLSARRATAGGRR